MTCHLPPNLLALFAPRDPVPYKEPVTKETHERKKIPITGIGEFVQNFEVSFGEMLFALGIIGRRFDIASIGQYVMGHWRVEHAEFVEVH